MTPLNPGNLILGFRGSLSKFGRPTGPAEIKQGPGLT